MKHTFLVSSAIKTKFGIYSTEQRLAQTVNTINSIKQRVPDAQIIIVECSGAGIDHDDLCTLSSLSDFVIDMSAEPSVVSLYNNTDNWDIVKNGCEMTCFLKAIAICYDRGLFNSQDRIHKMSGRYLLNDDFDIAFYDRPEVEEKIIICEKRASQFPITTTLQPFQYMSRLWSWPASRTTEILSVYEQGLQYFYERISQHGYVDIEHVLGKFLNQTNVYEQKVMGVSGNIAPNGTPVKD